MAENNITLQPLIIGAVITPGILGEIIAAIAIDLRKTPEYGLGPDRAFKIANRSVEMALTSLIELQRGKT